MGSAILDTYLQFIAENSSNNLGLGLSGKHAAVAAVASAMNEGDSSKLGEREEEDEIGEDRDRGADDETEEMESSAGEEEDEYSEEEQEVIKAE
jgi:hypothetical protein